VLAIAAELSARHKKSMVKGHPKPKNRRAAECAQWVFVTVVGTEVLPNPATREVVVPALCASDHVQSASYNGTYLILPRTRIYYQSCLLRRSGSPDCRPGCGRDGSFGA